MVQNISIFLPKKNTWILFESLPKDNQYLDDSDPNKFIADMARRTLFRLLQGVLSCNELSYDLRHKASNETSQTSARVKL